MTTLHPERNGFSAGRLSRLDRLLDHYVDSGRLAGALGLVYRNGEVVYTGARGQQALETGRPMSEDTIFRIYSMTKPIAAVAALMLYEDGHFLLDDPLSAYMPEFGETRVFTGDLDNLEKPERPVNIKDIFMHTAGLSYGWGQDSPVEEMYRNSIGNRDNLSLQTVVERLAGLPLFYHPGTQWKYSLATDVLGRLVEILSGKSLDEFFKQEIFNPLGMDETGFYVPAESLERFAACYSPIGGFSFGGDMEREVRGHIGQSSGGKTAGEPKIELQDPSRDSRYTSPPVFLSGGGGLVSTIGDYLRFLQMLLNGGVLDGNRLLGRKTVDLMRANHLPPALVPIGIGDSVKAGYGFGLGVSVLVDVAASNAPGSAGLYGWGGAASTKFWIDPSENMLGIFMTQLMPSGYYPVERQFRVGAYQALVA